MKVAPMPEKQRYIDLNDEQMIKKLMNEVSYLTEQDILRIEEQKRRWTVLEKKKTL